MDFFDRQERARKQTRRLIFLFCLAVLATAIVTYFILGTLILSFSKPVPGFGRTMQPVFMAWLQLFAEALLRPGEFLRWLWNGWLAVGISLGCLLSIAGGCFYKFRQLAGGGPAVAAMLGGRCVAASPEDADEQKLRHVVEEMAIAAGLPVPEIYVLDNERGINSFAAGHTRDDTAIVVTCGALKILSRDELQGLAAHEFSHILNGDTRLNMKLMALAHGLYWPTILGRVLTYGQIEPPDSGESFILEETSRTKILPTAPLGLLCIVIGSISLPAVRLLKSAICRQREWLADAAAIQFTRNPAGLTGALKKIGGLFKQGRLDTPNAETASHLYFANYSYDPWIPYLATHPPLEQRVRMIEPAFDGEFPRIKMLAPNQAEREQAFDWVAGGVVSVQEMVPERLRALTSTITEQSLRQAMIIRFGIPLEIKQALRSPNGAAALLYSLLLSDDAGVRARQQETLQVQLEAEAMAQVQALEPFMQQVDDKYKFPLVEFAVPTLRQAGLATITRLNQTAQKLVECGDAIDLFEYTLLKMVRRQLQAGLNNPAPETGRYGFVRDVLPECALLLSALAHVGQAEDETAARAAFARGAAFLDAPGSQIQFVPRSEWDLSRVDAALDRLAACPDGVRHNILMAGGKTVIADGAVTVREAELLRAIAETLGFPLPSFVEVIRNEELARDL